MKNQRPDRHNLRGLSREALIRIILELRAANADLTEPAVRDAPERARPVAADQRPKRERRPRGSRHGESRMWVQSHYQDCPRIQKWSWPYLMPCDCGDIFPPF